MDSENLAIGWHTALSQEAQLIRWNAMVVQIVSKFFGEYAMDGAAQLLDVLTKSSQMASPLKRRHDQITLDKYTSPQNQKRKSTKWLTM